MDRSLYLQVLGAGPAGLSVGYYAKKQGIPFRIFEGSGQIGGNCRTIKEGDFKYDTGAHRFHDKKLDVTSEIKKLMGDDLLKVTAPSKIHKDGRMIDFPINLSNLLGNLSVGQIFNILIENLFNMKSYENGSTNFKELSYRTYGKTLSDLFLINYTEKLWGRPAEVLQDDISGNRLKNLDVGTMIKQKLFGSDHYKNLDGSFYYPRDGFGAIFESLADHIGDNNIHLDSPVNKILHDGNKITKLVCKNEEISETDIVISSLPINTMVDIMSPVPPNDIMSAVKDISYRNIKICVIYLDIPFFSNNASIYFPEKKFNFTRIYEPKNRSADMAPKEKTCIVVESPYSKDDELSSKSDDAVFEMVSGDLINTGLLDKNQIIGHSILDLSNAYPILDVNLKEKKKKILSYLNAFDNMHLIGRNAQFQYLHIHDIISHARSLIDDIS